MSHRIISKPRTIRYQRSPTQLKRMNAYRKCCNLWRTLTQPEIRNAWQNFATEKETGFNAFIRINITHFFNDVEPLTYPPGVY